MNLMDIVSCKWDKRLLEICGGHTLQSKLGSQPVLGGSTLGTVGDWWVKKWGFHPGGYLTSNFCSCLETEKSCKDCIVAPFTGDNPATVVSLSAPGDAILSLGTSTTFLLSSDILPKRSTTSHLLAHPTDVRRKIVMLCYKNGALAREQVRDRCAKGDWHTFNEMVEQTPPGCGGQLGFFFPLPEIIPQNVVGNYFFKTTGLMATGADAPLPVDDIPGSLHPRAILESQLLSIRSRIECLLPKDSPHLRRLVLSGGGSGNQIIRQLAAVSNKHHDRLSDYRHLIALIS